FQANSRFEVVVGNSEGEVMLITNNTRAPMSNPLVRQAIAHALDRQFIIDAAMFGLGTPIGSHFAPDHPAYVDMTATYPFNPTAARRVLTEGGYPDSVDATLKVPPLAYAVQSAEVVAQLLRDVGIRLTVSSTGDFSTWLQTIFQNEQDYDFTIIAHAEPLDI